MNGLNLGIIDQKAETHSCIKIDNVKQKREPQIDIKTLEYYWDVNLTGDQFQGKCSEYITHCSSRSWIVTKYR